MAVNSNMTIIGGILAVVAGIGMFVLWIICFVKPFKAGDTLWGVLNLLIAPICPIIWGFTKGEKKLAIYWIIAFVVYLVGIGLVVAGSVGAIEGGNL